MRSLFACSLAAAVSCQGAAVSAQARLTGADVRGTAVDTSGSVLPEVEVTATRLDTNVSRTALTGPDGRYVIPALPPGDYEITAARAGFRAARHPDTRLTVGQSVRLDFRLGIAAIREEVEVGAQAASVDPGKIVVSEVIGQTEIDNLPINGRDFLDFVQLTPGVTSDRTAELGAAMTSGLSFGGQRSRFNNITVDGLDNNDTVVGSARALFSQEAVREFQVLTNSYSAEFGKASGGVLNIVTRSGTNRLLGSAFLFFRDESLNAPNHFEKFDVFGERIDGPKAPFSRTQWGANLGGPLREDRTFFFLSFERTDLRANNFVTIDPDAAQALRDSGFAVERGHVPYDAEVTTLLAKLNHQWSADHSIVVRANFSDTRDENSQPFGGIVARSRGAARLRKDWSLAVSQTDILSRRWVNEARIQLARTDQNVNSLDPSCGGPCLTESQGGPEVLIPGVADVGRQQFTPQPRKSDRVQIIDTLSFFHSRHHFKAGLDFSHVNHKELSIPVVFGGLYVFAPLPAIPGFLPEPITAVGALRRGLPVAYIRGFGNTAAPHGYSDLSFFVQDEWQAGPRLMLGLGLRYQKQFWPSLSYAVPDRGGTSRSYTYPQDSNNFAPRIGVAFDPAGDGRTSLHAAYGRFFANEIAAMVGITQTNQGTEDSVRILTVPFPSSITAWQAPGHTPPEPSTATPSFVASVLPGVETPFANHLSIGVDRALGPRLSIAANLLYVRGYHQLGGLEYNPILPALGPGRRPNDIDGQAGTSASVLQYADFGESWYQGLTLSLRRRFDGSHQFRVAYTLSKAEDMIADFAGAGVEDNGQGRNPADPEGLPLGFDPGSERGPANHDQRHRLVVSGLYRLPWDFQLSGIITAASGRPFNPVAGADLNGDGFPFPTDRARRDPADASTSVGRNSGTTERRLVVDARLSKTLRRGEHAALELIVEAFNLFDRTNFSEINNVFGVGAFPGEPQRDAQGRVTYGRYLKAGPPRQIQLAARLSF